MEEIIKELNTVRQRIVRYCSIQEIDEPKALSVEELQWVERLDNVIDAIKNNVDLHNVSGALPELSVWCCEHGTKCHWINFHGALQWGRFEKTATYEWRKKHKEMCGGKLIYLHEGNDR